MRDLFRWTSWRRVLAMLMAAALAVSVALGLVVWNEGRRRSATFIPPAPPPRPIDFRFQDITGAAGIRFKANNGAFGARWLPETVGAGGAFIDFDGDGWQDIFLVNGRNWTPQELAAYKNGTGREHERRHKYVIPPLGPHRRTTCALYRNNRDGTFFDVTKGSGLDIEMYGEGTAVGDYDNDGKVDLYVSAIGRNYLFRNLGARSGSHMSTHARGKSDAQPLFREEAVQAGVRGGGWSSSAAWVDIDRDGRLDLFVCQYVAWTPQTDAWKSFRNSENRKQYAAPSLYSPTSCHLYRNLGTGRFREISQSAGIAPPTTPARALRDTAQAHLNPTQPTLALNTANSTAADANADANAMNPKVANRGGSDALRGKSLGVTTLDFDADDWPDIAVTNDTTPNFLFRNNKDGTFSEVSTRAGLAMPAGDKARAGMGIDAGDIDGQNRDSLVIGNFDFENLGIYQNHGGVFTDFSANSPVSEASRDFVQFGCVFADFDLDSRLDILVANGHILGPDFNSAQRPLLFHNVEPHAPAINGAAALRNMSRTAFEEVGLRAGEVMRKPIVGRGLAVADIDLDGDLDALFTVNDGAPLLLRNDGGNTNNCLRVTLQGTRSNRSAIGAQVEATIAEDALIKRVIRRTVKSGSSYLSQSELPLAIGLGRAASVSLLVRWPSGRVTKIAGIAANQSVLIDEARGLVRRQALRQRNVK